MVIAKLDKRTRILEVQLKPLARNQKRLVDNLHLKKDPIMADDAKDPKAAKGAGNKKKRGKPPTKAANNAKKKKKNPPPEKTKVDPSSKKATSSSAPVAAATSANNNANANGATSKAKKLKAAPAAPAATFTATTTSAATSASAATISKPAALVDQVLFRLTEGVPRMELKAMIHEADECEKELLQEIQMLEAALAQEQAVGDSSATLKRPPPSAAAADTKPPGTKSKNHKPTTTNQPQQIGADSEAKVNALLENPLTPLDRCFTMSALLGRLRDHLAIPSIRRPPAALLAATTASNKKRKSITNTPAAAAAAAAAAATGNNDDTNNPYYTQLIALTSNPQYTRVHADPPTHLLAVWRKIASHRTSMVFRKPVKPEEAPGYASRILFPMDLSLVRKMIVSRILTSFSEVHQRIRLITHNCVKYNGRYVHSLCVCVCVCVCVCLLYCLRCCIFEFWIGCAMHVME